MGCDNWGRHTLADCPNCGKKNSAYIGYFFPMAPELTCSKACALRLSLKRQSGMSDPPTTPEERRIAHLRLCLTIAHGMLRRGLVIQ